MNFWRGFHAQLHLHYYLATCCGSTVPGRQPAGMYIADRLCVGPRRAESIPAHGSMRAATRAYFHFVAMARVFDRLGSADGTLRFH